MGNSANILLIPQAAGNSPGTWLDERDGITVAIGHYQWTTSGYAPAVYVSVSYTAEELDIQFRIHEPDPLIRYDRHNDPVHLDSCVECFLQPTPDTDPRYLNFELNAGGTMHLGLGTDRWDRIHLAQEECLPVVVSTETGQIDADSGDVCWRARLRIPWSWLAALFPALSAKPGARLRANFYKCGDETPVPHYGSWSKVESGTPDFHRSEYFGQLVLG